MTKKKHLATLLSVLMASGVSQAANVPVTGIRQINPTTVEVLYGNGKLLTLDFYGKNIFRVFQDPDGGIIRDPKSNPPAKILVDTPRHDVGALEVTEDDKTVAVATAEIKVSFDRHRPEKRQGGGRGDQGSRLRERPHHVQPQKPRRRVFLWRRRAERAFLAPRQAHRDSEHQQLD